jgi:hypothetical protein
MSMPEELIGSPDLRRVNVLVQVQKGDEGAASRCSLIALLGRY